MLPPSHFVCVCFVCACMCVCVCLCVCVCMYVCMCVCVCVYVCVCMYVCVCVCVYVCVCMYVCMYACLYVCMYVYIRLCEPSVRAIEACHLYVPSVYAYACHQGVPLCMLHRDLLVVGGSHAELSSSVTDSMAAHLTPDCNGTAIRSNSS